MPIQSRSSLAAVMTVSLAVATPLVFTQISPVWAQAGGGGGGSAGSGASSGSSGTGPSAPGSGTAGTGATGGATDRGGGGTGRTMSDTRPGMGPGMGRESTGSSMSGNSGNDATRGAGGTRGEDGSLVGTEKLNAALGALDGTTTTTSRGRRAASSARLVQMEEYETAMRNALAIQDPAQRSAAVSEARERLQRATNRQVSSDEIARVDSILGLPATSVNR